MQPKGGEEKTREIILQRILREEKGYGDWCYFLIHHIFPLPLPALHKERGERKKKTSGKKGRGPRPSTITLFLAEGGRGRKEKRGCADPLLPLYTITRVTTGIEEGMNKEEKKRGAVSLILELFTAFREG